MISKSGKLFICVVGRHSGEKVIQTAKNAGALGGTIIHGHVAAENRVLQALSLSEIHQDVVFIAMSQETSAVIEAVRDTAAKIPGKHGGVGVLLDVPSILVRKFSKQAKDYQGVFEKRSLPMESDYTLVCAIVNSGCGNELMLAARKAGAEGGTIIKARGTGTEEDVKFFNIVLVPEKEMLLIVAKKKMTESITAALGKVAGISKPSAGIVFNLPVECFYRLHDLEK